jgi:hypothetical protein
VKPLLTLLLTLWAAGCCGGPDYALLAYDARFELETRDGFAVIATVSSDSRAWAYGAPAALLLPHSADYRPGSIADVDSESVTILEPTQAPPQIADALAALSQGALELGYSPARVAAGAEFVLSVAISWYDDGSVARVAVNVGGDLDGDFDPHVISIAATLPENDPCPSTTVELVQSLVSLLPPREDAEEAP